MPPIVSRLNASSDAFVGNRAAMDALVVRLREIEARTRAKSAASKPLFDKRGQLLPRERIGRLLDYGSPWLELSPLAGFMVDVPDPERSTPGAGAIAGIGYVSGTRCLVFAISVAFRRSRSMAAGTIRSG